MYESWMAMAVVRPPSKRNATGQMRLIAVFRYNGTRE
jgi:hypothetical protein